MINRKFTDSTLFLLPMFQLPKDEYDKAGLINAYAQDDSKMFIEPVCLLLFGNLELYGDKQGDLVTLFDDQVIDVYTYPGDLTVVALKIPEEMINDYWIIMSGQYSQLSSLYREKVENKVWARMQSTNTSTIAKEKRLQLRIIEKDPMIAKMSGMVGNDQVWPLWNDYNELITGELINNIQNGE